MLPPNEAARLRALHELEILDTPPSPPFDRIAEIARRVFGVPSALVVLVDERRAWFKSAVGLQGSETPRELAFCSYTIMHDEVMVVPDAQRDHRFAANPFVAGEPFLRFYAGAPLIVRPGIRLGSLCILDRIPRHLNELGARRLERLARIVAEELWIHAASVAGLSRPDYWRRGKARQTSGSADEESRITGAQVRAARGLLNWSVRQLAEAARIGTMTVKRIEAQDGVPVARDQSLDTVRRALETAGVEFLFDGSARPGVRPADPARPR